MVFFLQQEIKRLKSEATGDVTQESTETRDEKISNPDNVRNV